MMILAVVNRKGGTSKTTSAGLFAHVFHEAGLRVIVVDTDSQGTMMRWSEDADWQIPVIRLDSPKMHRTLSGIIGDSYDVVVIDTPPSNDGIISSALRIATHVVIPTAPTPPEHERVAAVRELLDEVEPLRADGPPIVAVLLTRTVPNAASTRVYRDQAVSEGFHVLQVTVGRRESLAQAIGSPVARASAGPYGDAAAELMEMTPEGVR